MKQQNKEELGEWSSRLSHIERCTISAANKAHGDSILFVHIESVLNRAITEGTKLLLQYLYS